MALQLPVASITLAPAAERRYVRPRELMRRQVARFVILCCASIPPAFGEAQFATSLSAEDRELVVLALNSQAAGGLLVDSTAPVCGSTVVPLCIRRDMLTAGVINWDSPDAPPMRDAFFARNEKAISIGSLDVRLTSVPRATVEAIFVSGGTGWPDLQRIYPGVRYVTQVSAPAYSSDGNRALIYVETVCFGRCGGGALLLFDRRAGRWLLARSLINWIG